MAPYDAAKIFLGHLLYVNASVAERDKGLYAPNCTSEEFNQAVEILKNHHLPPRDIMSDIPGGYMMYAAISAAREW